MLEATQAGSRRIVLLEGSRGSTGRLLAPVKLWSTSCGARAHQMQDPRIVTLLFTDVEASTRLFGSLGDTFVALIERHRAILTGAAGARRGSGYPTGGDGCVFIFGSAGDAVAAAIEAQRALAAEPWPGGTPVRVRMAIHAGEVTEVGDELFGLALHQASRILAVTHGGQIVVSEAAVGLIAHLAPDISLLDLGTHRLRDIARPVRLHQVVAEGIPTSFPPLKVEMSDASHLPAPTTSFVGREREPGELRSALESVIARLAGPAAVYRLAAGHRAHAARHGPLVLVDHRAGSARLRCSESHDDAWMRCLRRQAWLLHVVAGGGGTRATVREDRCVCSGEPACEYVVSWTARSRVTPAAAAAAIVALGLVAAMPHVIRPSAAWALVPAVAVATHAVERRRCASSARASSAESGAAFHWLLGQVVAARAEATAPLAVPSDDHAEPVQARHPGIPVMEQEGEFWRIEYQGTAVMLRHSRGLTLLAHLVRCPGRAIHVRDLDAITPSGGAALPRPEAPDSDLVAVPGDACEVLDRQALAEYRSRVGELRVEIDDADACGDAARAEALRAELDMLASELGSAVGAGGRVRRVPPEVERLRTAITRRIRSAIVKIAEHHPKLGAHLQAHVSTGYTCAYEPGDTTDARDGSR
jgi:class 3 adenylate cyclase